MRTMLLEWIIEVCHDRRLHRETFYLCVDYVDRYFENTENLSHTQLQLIGSTALALASKMEEIYPPKISEISEYTDGACNEEEICRLEENFLMIMNWKLSPITTIHWIGIYLKLMYDNNIKPQPIIQPKVIKRPCLATLDWSATFNNANNSISDSELDNSINNTNSSVLDYSMISNFSYSDGHIYPDKPMEFPKILRDEFIRLAGILDLIQHDYRSCSFKYQELAAALFACCYEPEDLVLEITGFKTTELFKACRFVEPFVIYSRKMFIGGVNIPRFSNSIPNSDRHNIQTLMENALGKLKEVEEIRQEMEKKQNSNFRGRKRKRMPC